MTGPDDPEFARSMCAASARVQELHGELHDAHPPFRGNLAIPGIFLGHGLGSFVANGMPNDQIVAHVLAIVAQIRQTASVVANVQSSADAPSNADAPDVGTPDDVTVH